MTDFPQFVLDRPVEWSLDASIYEFIAWGLRQYAEHAPKTVVVECGDQINDLAAFFETYQPWELHADGGDGGLSDRWNELLGLLPGLWT